MAIAVVRAWSSRCRRVVVAADLARACFSACLCRGRPSAAAACAAGLSLIAAKEAPAAKGPGIAGRKGSNLVDRGRNTSIAMVPQPAGTPAPQAAGTGQDTDRPEPDKNTRLAQRPTTSQTFRHVALVPNGRHATAPGHADEIGVYRHANARRGRVHDVHCVRDRDVLVPPLGPAPRTRWRPIRRTPC
jgi:hypothetical protein